MPSLIQVKDSVKLILTGGPVCSGKYTVGGITYEKIKSAGLKCEFISLAECLRYDGELAEDAPKEAYDAIFAEKEDNPWLVTELGKELEIDGDEIMVISGLSRKCDVEYFHTNFPNSKFLHVLCDDDTLVQRVLARNAAKNFPRGTPESEKEAMAKRLIAEEGKKYLKMMMYMSQISKDRIYLVDNGKRSTGQGLENTIFFALKHFNLV